MPRDRTAILMARTGAWETDKDPETGEEETWYVPGMGDALRKLASKMERYVDQYEDGELLSSRQLASITGSMRSFAADRGPLGVTRNRLAGLIRRDNDRKVYKMEVPVRERVERALAYVLLAIQEFDISASDLRSARGFEPRALAEYLELHRFDLPSPLRRQLKEEEDWDADVKSNVFVMTKYKEGMAAAQAAWFQLFYALQKVKPIEQQLDAKSAKRVVNLLERGADLHLLPLDELPSFLKEARRQADSLNRTVEVRDENGLFLVSFHPHEFGPTARQSAGRGAARRDWSYVRKVASKGMNLGDLTPAQKRRVTALLKRDGEQPVHYLTSRIILEEHYRDAYGVDISDATPLAMQMAINIIADEGPLPPANLAARLGGLWRQEAGGRKQPPKSVRDFLQELEAAGPHRSRRAEVKARYPGYAPNPEEGVDPLQEQAEHDAMMSLRY